MIYHQTLSCFLQKNPKGVYVFTKLKGEKIIIRYLKKKINYGILRYFNVAGSDPFLRSGLISENPTHLIKIACEVAFNKRKYIEIFGKDYPTPDGTAIRDYIHISDLAEIHNLTLNYLLTSKKSHTFNCGYGRGYSVKYILDTMNTILKKPIEIKIAQKRKGDAVSLVADVNKIKQILKWKPQYDKIEDILKTAIKWEEKILNE